MSEHTSDAKASGSLFNFKVRARLIMGFSAVCLVLIVVVGVTIVRVGQITDNVERIESLRVPTAFASGSMLQGIQASLATLRGWMLTGNESFKNGRAEVWANIDKESAAMDRLSQSWTNAENVKLWTEFKAILAEFRIAQQ